MEPPTPPYSDSSDDGRTPQWPPNPRKRGATDFRAERSGVGKTARTSTPCPTCGSDRTRSGIVTLHEESLELSKSEVHLPSLQAFIVNLSAASTAKRNTQTTPNQRENTLLGSWEDDDLGVVE